MPEPSQAVHRVRNNHTSHPGYHPYHPRYYPWGRQQPQTPAQTIEMYYVAVARLALFRAPKSEIFRPRGDVAPNLGPLCSLCVSVVTASAWDREGVRQDNLGQFLVVLSS